MRVHVDTDRCTIHAQCVFAAPEVFTLDDREELVYDPSPSDDLADEVEEAARACPVQAILVGER